MITITMGTSALPLVVVSLNNNLSIINKLINVKSILTLKSLEIAEIPTIYSTCQPASP